MEFSFLTDATAYALVLHGIKRQDIERDSPASGSRATDVPVELKRRGILVVLAGFWFRVWPPNEE